MGLLDDAIREHLELKRKHGADPTEVARQEREALGSGRVPPRAADPDAAAEPEPVAASGGLALDDLPPAPVEDDPPFEDPLPEPTRVEEPRIEEPRGGAVSMQREPEPEPDPEPEIDWTRPPTIDDPPPAPAARAEDEDVLEETPDFLQETPEHDRLWFEQRPPKDFDF